MVMYYILLLDLAVLISRLSAYVIDCGRLVLELWTFSRCVGSVLMTMCSSLGCFERDQPEFRDIESGLVAMWEMILAKLSQDDYNQMHNEPVVLFLSICT